MTAVRPMPKTDEDGGEIIALPVGRVRVVELTDEALLAACAVGDTNALGVLFDRHHDALRAFLDRLARPHADESDDLVQATFVNVWQSARRFHGGSAVRTWIFAIASNLVRRRIRSEGRKRGAFAVLATAPESHSDRPDDAAIRAQLLDRLGPAIAALSHELREVFVLCDVEGIAGVEVARALRLRQGTVWRRLHDARRKLRRALEGEST